MSEELRRITARRITRSAAATRSLGRRLGALLRPGDVVALEGDLGAGKTELVRGACAGAEVPSGEVSSPSFAIVATYRGRIPLHHADLYRIGDEDELYGTGFGDLVGGEGALLVEWADRVPGALPAERLTIRLAHDPRLPSARHLELVGIGARHADLLRALVARSRAKKTRPAGRSQGGARTRKGSKGRGPAPRSGRPRRRRGGRGRDLLG